MKKQLENLWEEIKKEDEETGTIIKEQEKELTECKKESKAIVGHEGKLKTRVQELKEELKQAQWKLDNL